MDRWLAWAADTGAVQTPPKELSRVGWMVTSYETRGPYTDEEVRALIRAGEIAPYHRLWKLGVGPQRKARDMPGFANLFESR